MAAPSTPGVPSGDVPDAKAPFDPAQLGRKPMVSPESFFASDLRVGRVVKAAPLEGARKPAYRLRVDLGPAAGVLETSAQVTRYPLDEMNGRLVVALINIGRKRIAGLTSGFLVLGALDPDGAVRLLRPEDERPPAAPVA